MFMFIFVSGRMTHEETRRIRQLIRSLATRFASFHVLPNLLFAIFIVAWFSQCVQRSVCHGNQRYGFHSYNFIRRCKVIVTTHYTCAPYSYNSSSFKYSFRLLPRLFVDIFCLFLLFVLVLCMQFKAKLSPLYILKNFYKMQFVLINTYYPIMYNIQ